jgi:hypothetical protein
VRLLVSAFSKCSKIESKRDFVFKVVGMWKRVGLLESSRCVEALEVARRKHGLAKNAQIWASCRFGIEANFLFKDVIGKFSVCSCFFFVFQRTMPDELI